MAVPVETSAQGGVKPVGSIDLLAFNLAMKLATRRLIFRIDPLNRATYQSHRV
jgi:hypothetical protein